MVGLCVCLGLIVVPWQAPGHQTTEVAILALLANGLELARPVFPALCLILASPEFHQASEHFHFLLHILPDLPPYSW